MSLLMAEDLYKTFGEKVIFDHLSFTIEAKDRIGLIGVNGTGKSTLLKVLAGIESTEVGQIVHANAFRLEYLPQNPEFVPGVTALEYIFGGESRIMKVLRQYEHALQAFEKSPENEAVQKAYFTAQQQMDVNNAWEAGTLAKTILTKLGVAYFEEDVSFLSGGQRKRVAIARALIQPADLLMLDEPTNHLDNETIEWLESHLGQYSGALILVTHDRYFLNRVTNRIIELDKGRLYNYAGNYEIFLEKKAEREEQAILSEEKRQNTLRRELAWLRRGAKARTTKQKARIQRVEHLRDQDPDLTKNAVDVAIGSSRLGKKVIELKDVSVFYEGAPLIQNFSYLVTPGERLGIIGPNGSGKTTLLNIMAGCYQPDNGVVDRGQTVKCGYYTQENEALDESLRIIDFIKETAEVIRTVDGDLITAEQMLERFLFSRSAQYTYIGKLSGGERRRLYLLSVLMTEPNVLFLDEPTNDLDTETLAVLEDFLEYFPGVVITVSHDRYFLDRVVDRLIAFEEDGHLRRFEGNYSDYLEVRHQELSSKNLEDQQLKTTFEVPKKERKKKLSFKEQKEWVGLEDKITELESRIEAIQHEIASAGSDLGKVQPLFEEQQQVETELENAMERWTALSELIEEIESQN